MLTQRLRICSLKRSPGDSSLQSLRSKRQGCISFLRLTSKVIQHTHTHTAVLRAQKPSSGRVWPRGFPVCQQAGIPRLWLLQPHLPRPPLSSPSLSWPWQSAQTRLGRGVPTRKGESRGGWSGGRGEGGSTTNHSSESMLYPQQALPSARNKNGARRRGTSGQGAKQNPSGRGTGSYRPLGTPPAARPARAG